MAPHPTGVGKNHRRPNRLSCRFVERRILIKSRQPNKKKPRKTGGHQYLCLYCISSGIDSGPSMAPHPAGVGKNHRRPNRLSCRFVERRILIKSRQPNKKKPRKTGLFFVWRRDRDSNPGRYCYLAGFQDQCIQPLCHPSGYTTILHGSLR